MHVFGEPCNHQQLVAATSWSVSQAGERFCTAWGFSCLALRAVRRTSSPETHIGPSEEMQYITDVFSHTTYTVTVTKSSHTSKVIKYNVKTS